MIVLLSILGILLILAEIFLIPGIFVTGMFGLGSLAASCYYAFALSQTAGIITTATNTILLVICIILAFRADTWKKLSLKATISSKADYEPEAKDIHIGSTGVTLTRLNPIGKAMFGNTTVEVASRNDIIESRQEVEVAFIEDNKIYVTLKH